jgi:hypothetical protein
MRSAVLALLLTACGAGGVTSTPPSEASVEDSALETSVDSGNEDSGAPDVSADTTPAMTDLDGDGLDDALEDKIAAEYLPFLSFDPTDTCPRSVIVFRLYPHPDAKDTRLHLIVDTLFEKDCGASGHVGDNEVFGVTIDRSKPAPAGILAVRAISHQGTSCEAITNCGTCAGLTACETAMRKGSLFPVVYYSKNKHGAYLQDGKCDNACFFTNFCTLAPTPSEPKMLNVGEPGKPLVKDLTSAGLITTASGWTEMSVFNYDPWGDKEFGKAGKVGEDLIDKAFLTPACP